MTCPRPCPDGDALAGFSPKATRREGCRRPRCGGSIVEGQQIGPLFSPKIVTWSAHPVLSKPVTLRGIISTNGSPGRSDLSLGEQLRQRAAMGGEKERAELGAFETLMATCIASALVAQLQKDAEAQGIDVPTLLAREASQTKP
jgi:hypothetical protein